jgi:hypothetical protein
MRTSSLLIETVAYTRPAPGAVRRVAELLVQAVAVSSGRTALDYVHVPDAQQQAMSPRTRRLVRCAQVSAW